MDINKYMEQSLEMQVRQTALLQAILEQLSKGETIQVRVPVETAEAILGAKRGDEHPEDMKDAALISDAANGSGKQAANHDRDDQAQVAEKEKKVEAATGEKPKSADDVRAALMALGKRQGSDAAIALLKKYDATSVSGVKVEDYDKLIADAGAL